MRVFLQCVWNYVVFILTPKMAFEQTHAYEAIKRSNRLSEENKNLTLEAAEIAWRFIHLGRFKIPPFLYSIFGHFNEVYFIPEIFHLEKDTKFERRHKWWRVCHFIGGQKIGSG